MAYLEKLQHKAPAALVAAASIGILVPYEIYAQAPGQNMNTIIARGDYGLTYSTDANAKPEEFKEFKIDELMKGKQYILVQGYNGCQFCNKIGANLAKIRKALNAAGKQDIPIVVINVRPEKDKDNLAAYAKEYVDAEICTANSFGKNLIIAFPRNWNAAHDLQDAIGASYLRQDAWPKDDKILHGMRIAVVDSDGVCKAAALGTVEDNVKSQKLVNTVLNVLGNGRSRQ